MHRFVLIKIGVFITTLTHQPPVFLTENMFTPALAPRQNDAHKGLFGSVLVIGGSTGMMGAVVLAARSALLCGAGKVYAVFLAEDAPRVDYLHPEIMIRLQVDLAEYPDINSVVIGPGLGRSSHAVALMEYWLTKPVNLLLDADALNLIALHAHLSQMVVNRTAQTVITPHPGEAARLLSTDIAAVQKNRIESAHNLAEKMQVICVLKGANSICVHYDGRAFINTNGNPGLASGGTGDVLSGIIGGLTAQNLCGLNAAKLGIYVHGAAADALLAHGFGPVGMTASEVSYEARKVINYLNGRP